MNSSMSGMVHAHHPHLGSAAMAGGGDALADRVEDVHEADGAGGVGLELADQVAARTEGAEVIADPAAHPHRGCGFRGPDHDGAFAVHEAVVDRPGDIAVVRRDLAGGAHRGLDAARREEAHAQEGVPEVREVMVIVLQGRGDPVHGLAEGLAAAAVLLGV